MKLPLDIKFDNYFAFIEACASCSIEGNEYGEKIMSLYNSPAPEDQKKFLYEYLQFELRTTKREKADKDANT